MAENVSAGSRTINTDGLRAAIKTCINAKRPAMIWGPAGVGKSDVVADLCQEMDGALYDIRLSLLEPTDLRGIPFYNRETGKMEWAPPVDLPDAETASKYPIVFVFFDEINSAAPSVQAACYQLALNRRVGQYRLPDNAVIMMAGNREGDRGVTYRMPAPLANRLIHLELRADFDPWHTWAVKNKIHADVIGFLNFSKNSLYDFDPKSSSKSFATPRTWEFVSQLLADETCPETTFADVVSGAIGEGLALKFMGHRKIAASLPLPMDVMTGKVKELKVKNEISVQYSLSISCCYELMDQLQKVDWKKGKEAPEDWHKLADTFLGFIMSQFQTEVVVMAMRLVLKTYELPCLPKKMKNYEAFYQKYGKLVLQASKNVD